MKIIICFSPSFSTLLCVVISVRLCFTKHPDRDQPNTKAVLQLRFIHWSGIYGKNRPLMFSWCERACAVCGWRAGMYGWNAGGELSDRFGLW